MLGLILLSWLFSPAAAGILCLLLLTIWIVGYYRSGSLLPKTPYNLPFLLLVVLTGFSVFITPNIERSAGKIIGILAGILLFYASIRWVISRYPGKPQEISIGKSAWLILGFVCSGGLIALLGLLGADWFSKYPTLTRFSGLIPKLIPDLPGTDVGFQPNAISGTLTLITPLSVMVFYQFVFLDSESLVKEIEPLSERLVKAILALNLVFQGAWWVLAQTRGAWLGLFCGMLFLVLLIWKPTWVRTSWIFPLLIVGVVYLYWFQMEDISTGVLNLEKLGGDLLTNNLAVRLQIWRWAFWVLHSFPYTGVGLNMFRDVAPFLFLSSNLVDIAHAHNIWLNIGVSLGWGGFAVYGSIWIVTISSLLKNWPNEVKSLKGRLVGGLAAGWYGYFVFGIADVIPLGSKMGILLFIYFAVVYLVGKETIDEKNVSGQDH